MKQYELAKWLKFITVATSIMGLLFCFLIVPMLGKDAVFLNPELEFMYMPSLIFIWITAIPFYMALWRFWNICCQITYDNSFCEQNIKSLKQISKLAIMECALYFVGILTLLFLELLHPGLLLIALFIIFAGLSIAVVSAVLAHLVQKAYDMKQENELTI